MGERSLLNKLRAYLIYAKVGENGEYGRTTDACLL